MNLIDNARSIQLHLVDIRRELHQHPEESNKEKDTAELIKRELMEIGSWTIRDQIGGYGVLADLVGAVPGPHTALRADMDALSIQEETNLPFSSQNPGVMHACGHDNHITCLLGAARLLAMHKNQLKGQVRLIFQPAEENAPVGGSRKMIAAGALEGIDRVFGLHVWPNLSAGVLGAKPGPQMAASDHFIVRIKGESAHGAMPHLGKDALIAGAHFVSAVQTIISRNSDPLDPGVITIGVMKAGSRYNIVPEECLLEGTCRTYSAEMRELAEKRLEQLLKGICSAYGCEGDLDYQRGYSALRNDPEQVEYLLTTWGKLFGQDRSIRVPQPAMTAEDFSFYLEKTPGAFGWLGTQAENDPEVWPLHSSHYKANEDVLWKGAALFAALALGV